MNALGFNVRGPKRENADITQSFECYAELFSIGLFCGKEI